MHQDDKIIELEAKVAELTAIVERLTVERDVPARSRTETVEVDATGTKASRRHLLKLAGAATVGAAAAVATGALPAAATNGINIADPSLPVRNDYTGNAAQAAFLFQAGSQFTNAMAAYDCALAGWSGTGGSNLPNGVYGYTNNGGFGVVGSGGSDSTGVLARGSKANLQLLAMGTAAPLRTATYELGDVINDEDGNVWTCVGAGTPGTWRKLTGPAAAGTLHLLATPVRVYDSRPSASPNIAPKTPLSNATRTIDCTLNSSGVPAGAAGLVLNLTVITLTANGFLAVAPGGAGFTGTSNLNWTAAGAVVANSVTVGSGAGGTIDVTVGGGGNTDFIVDVFGYYL